LTTDFVRDYRIWSRRQGENNDEQLERVRRNLRDACLWELTEHQLHLFRMFYDEGLSVTQIAQREGLSKSTVSRTIQRGRERLRRCLIYSL
jgi:RNA polymerase sigma factor (sigma-70 family)